MKTPSRKILSVVLAVAVLASLLATSVFAGQRAVGVGAVTAAQSTMRTGPESDAAELAQLTAGTDVAVLGQSGGLDLIRGVQHLCQRLGELGVASKHLRVVGLEFRLLFPLHPLLFLAESVQLGQIPLLVEIAGFKC